MAWEIKSGIGIVTNYENDETDRAAMVTIDRSEVVEGRKQLAVVPSYRVTLYYGTPVAGRANREVVGSTVYKPKRKPNPEALSPRTVGRICAEIEASR